MFLVVAAGLICLVFVSRSCMCCDGCITCVRIEVPDRSSGSASHWHEEAFFGVSVISSN